MGRGRGEEGVEDPLFRKCSVHALIDSHCKISILFRGDRNERKTPFSKRGQ